MWCQKWTARKTGLSNAISLPESRVKTQWNKIGRKELNITALVQEAHVQTEGVLERGNREEGITQQIITGNSQGMSLQIAEAHQVPRTMDEKGLCPRAASRSSRTEQRRNKGQSNMSLLNSNQGGWTTVDTRLQNPGWKLFPAGMPTSSQNLKSKMSINKDYLQTYKL